MEPLLSGVLSAIGHTPLVRLRRLLPEAKFALYAKLEWMNPGGSSKDRAALQMIVHAWQRGEINRHTVVIESSSGNMAISLSQICAYFGLRLICVIDSRTTELNRRILQAYGAEVQCVTEPDPASGQFVPARLARVHSLRQQYPNSFWPNQYDNPQNALAHYRTTMHEIVAELGRVDVLFCGMSTCGTLRGCTEYVLEHQLDTKIVAVDAKCSVLYTGEREQRLLPGLGAGVVPGLYRGDGVKQTVFVSNEQCVAGCRKLAATEAILAGGSSGGVVSALLQLYTDTELPDDAICVVLLPDRGERYLDTVYSDSWVERHFGGELR